jgi:RNA polymerase sigma-70 factor, ECF subfamily
VPTSADESLWVLRAQYGDRDALERILRRLQPALLNYLRGLVGDHEAQDTLQDVLVLIYRKLQGLDNPDVFRPWAFRIASRAAFRRLRKRRRLPVHVGEEALDAVADPTTPPDIDPPTVLSMIDAVSPASRAVLVLHFQEEMTLAEVAAVLEIPLGTVRSRLAYGLTTLRQLLAKKNEEEQ